MAGDEPAKPCLIEMTRGVELVAPATLPWEVGNALSAMLKRRRITKLPEAVAGLPLPYGTELAG